jgi:hypothetical protein
MSRETTQAIYSKGSNNTRGGMGLISSAVSTGQHHACSMLLIAHKVQKNIYDTARVEEAVDVPCDRGRVVDATSYPTTIEREILIIDRLVATRDFGSGRRRRR